ncbi:hypothetical protein PUN28_007513 [Cardiocondyla obscurior]|uniref:Uncharacterized protein n=1 Tax=Cardiocondyla obscurior TaxID=286306 RepID=A0AAW2G9X7_9HYME
MGPDRSLRANIDRRKTSGEDSRRTERDRMAPVWKCDRSLNVEPRAAMLIPARVSRGVTSVYLRIGPQPDLTNTSGPPARREKCTCIRGIKKKSEFIRFFAHVLLHRRRTWRISSADLIRCDGFTWRATETRRPRASTKNGKRIHGYPPFSRAPPRVHGADEV